MIGRWVSIKPWAVGLWLVTQIEELGRFIRFTGGAFRALVSPGIPGRLIVSQIFDCGVRALPTTCICGFFVGAIMALQIELQLKNFGAEGTVGGIATSVTIRNVGPVLIAFILAGKVGALTTAVLGTMRVTDQIDSLVSLGVDPIPWVVTPRLIAAMVSSFLLLVVGLVISVGGGAAMASMGFGLNLWHYIAEIPRFVEPWSVAVGAFKSVIFGCAIGAIACYRGYHVTGGSAGVGRTVRDAAIVSLIAIILLNCLISLVASYLRGLV